MPYNAKQYDAAVAFVSNTDTNLSFSAWDQKRVGVYDLYENIYRNALVTLQIVLRGDDQSPILIPNGRKIIEATSRFLAKNFDYFVDAGGDGGTQELVDTWFKAFFRREAMLTKFNSNKRWGLCRGDAYFYVYSKENKPIGERICCDELDPRQVFEIEDEQYDLVGVHIVDLVKDFREPDQPDKQIVRRRTFRLVFDGPIDPTVDQQQPAGSGVSSELTYWELGKWDDRNPQALANQQQIPNPGFDEPAYMLPPSITKLPVYKWRNDPAQNSSWGTSCLAGLETLLYALNQSLSDEDATMVFQGLGMYVTNASPPIDPNTGEVTDWNIGPKQIIEISGEQKFDRVTGITDISPFTQHMDYIDNNMMEASGTPQTAVGRVDVTVAESGISLFLQLMPLIAANADKELEIINVMDQMLHDITTMWLPAYEPETFPNADALSEINVVCIFDDPMPVDHTAEVTEVVTLDQANLILKTMAIAKLRELGWKYPSVDPTTGAALTDEDIANMLLSQTQQYASAIDPFAGTQAYDANGNPIDPNAQQDQGFGQSFNGNTPQQTSIPLGTS